MDEELLRIIDLFDEDEVTTADQIDRPQRALEREMYDDFMKRNKLAGGGMLVQPGFGGTRQGYSEAKGEITDDIINIKDIKKYNKNLLNKAITLGDPNRPGLNQADKVTLQNIFDVVKRTKDGDVLINSFKKNPNAETLQKLKRRRKNRLMFEKQQALPPLEKIELRKRKRIAEQKWRNSGKGIKFYNSYLSQGGIFPARTAEERVWRDIYRASKQKKGESRFIIKYPKSANVDKTSGLPQTVTSKLTGNDYIPWDKFYKDITFYDTVTKKNIKFNTVKKWMTDNVQDGARKYDNAIKNYKASNVINTFEVDGVALSKLAKDKQKGDFIKRITTAAAVNHRSGLNNFWDTEVTTSSGNKMLNDKVQANIKAYKNASNPNIEKKLLNIMKQNAKKIEGGGTIVLDDKITLGKKPTIKSVVSALEKELGVKIPPKQIAAKLREIGFKCKFAKLKADGGRIDLSTDTGRCDDPMSYVDDIKKQEDLLKVQTSKAPQAIKTLNTARKLNAARSLFTSTLGPGALAFEAVAALPIAYMGYKGGKSPENIIADSTFNLIGKSDKRVFLDKAVEMGFDTANIKRAQDLLKKEEAFEKQDARADEFMGPDDMFMYPQMVQKAERDLLDVTKQFIDPKTGQVIPERVAAFDQIPLVELGVAKDQADLATKRQEQVGGFLQSPIADYLPGLAGGGIAKLAGVDSGPPPESGPNSQGLQGLMKRVRNI